MAERILVTGATGKLGSAVTKALASAAFEVEAGSRHPGSTWSVNNVQGVWVDFDDTKSFNILKDMDGLFLISPPFDPDAPAKLNPIIDMAKEC